MKTKGTRVGRNTGIFSKISTAGFFFAALFSIGNAIAQNPAGPVTLESGNPDIATIAAGNYTEQASYWNGALSVTNNGTFSLTSNATYVLSFTTQWTGGAFDNGLAAADGADAGNAGYLSGINSGAVTLNGLGSQISPVTAVEFVMLGGFGGSGNNSMNGGNGGNASAGLGATNQAPITLFGGFNLGGSALLVSANGGDGGAAEGSHFVGAGGSSVAAGAWDAVNVQNSGTLSVGTETERASGAAGFTGLQATAIGGQAGFPPIPSSPSNGRAEAFGGSAGNVVVSNDAPVSLFWQPSDSNPSSLYGIFAASLGANGSTSSTSSQNGGAGGTAAPVTLTLSPNGDVTLDVTTTTSGNGTANTSGAAVYAGSRGGDGGGGWTSSTGGLGGNALGGPTTITANGTTVSASGNGIAGMIVETVGGDGGNGAANQNSSAGGNAGYGNQVKITFEGNATVSTNGANATAVLARSVGGSGGNGTVYDDDGGNGGDGGQTGLAEITTLGTTSIQTQGDNSAALLAMSQGGNGGAGGGYTGYTGTGGYGGEASFGSAVNVSLASSTTLSTHGENSGGVLGISLGGIGGDSGSTTSIWGQTYAGGHGGDSSLVQINTAPGGSITTVGNNSHAIAAVSRSGAGGAGGQDVEVLGGESGQGGPGGTAGSLDAETNTYEAVIVENGANLSTAGADSVAILAQGLSGAGGNGSTASGLFYAAGGNGSSSGLVGTATVTNTGSISTGPLTPPQVTSNSTTQPGTASHGILAQSIAGGGGAAGGSLLGIDSVGGAGTSNQLAANGNLVSVSNNGDISTTGSLALGILAQSIGGGGGDGGSSISLLRGIGGSGGPGGNGGNVTVFHGAGSISTANQSAHGIVAQSIGGGGGNGGSAQSVDVLPNYAVGGGASAGGNGGLASVSLQDGSITTDGIGAIGIVSQSIGGGGGTGGAAYAASASALIAAAGAVGGQGGAGGNGTTAEVFLENTSVATGQSATIVTAEPLPVLPTDSYGIVVQSIGGGGGNAGSATSQAMAIAPPTPYGQLSIEFNYTVGGTGGTGGNGGAANLLLDQGTQVSTAGQGSHALIVQSIGAGGGTGGDSSSLSAGFSASRDTIPGDNETKNPFGKTLNIAIGLQQDGSGGGGGDGGSASATVGGNGTAVEVWTLGDYANGLQVQSIGGGGGNAGFGSTSTMYGGASYGLNFNANLGATGGEGGSGGAATASLSSNSSILTLGEGARGILAQSVGGGGGVSSGSSFSGGLEVSSEVGQGSTIANTLSANITLGKTGGDAAEGGTVSVTVDGSIRTYGNDATGVLAQSVGGGGGTGGSSAAQASSDNPYTSKLVYGRTFVTNELEGTTPVQSTLGLTLGGTGGSGGNGSTVSVELTQSILTGGDWAHGILAQSVGGGGGVGGTAVASGQGGIPALTINLAGAEGGAGGIGGTGGNVTATLDGAAIQTGVIPTNVPAGRPVPVGGYSAFGLLAQSVGGGGGYAADGSDVATGVITVGGTLSADGGAAGSGGSVALNTGSASSQIQTAGDASHGVFLQSVGGGGGIGSAGSSLFGGIESVSGNVTLGVGGGAAASGHGGGINLDNSSALNITTAGDNAYGFLAQSIGGGGLGMAQNAPGTATVNSNSANGSVNLGGNTSVQSNGGEINLNFAAGTSISTQGLGSHAILAQSVGGGGGIANGLNGGTGAPTLETAVPARFVTNGQGGSVFVNQSGNVTTSGDMAFGVLAQSIGGGGGLMASGNTLYAGSTGATGSQGGGNSITIFQESGAHLSVHGENSVGIFAQSTGAGGADGNMQLDIAGSIQGGNGTQGYGIQMLGGSANTLSIATTGSVSALSGQAIYYQQGNASSGSLTVQNAGSVTGNVTSTEFQNLASGNFYTGTFADTNVTDAGVTFIGNALPGTIGTLVVNGDYTQTTTSTMEFGFAGAADFDRLIVNDIGSFEGYVNLWFLGNYLPELNQTFSVITAAVENSATDPFDFIHVGFNNLPTGYEMTTFTSGDGLAKTFNIQFTAIPEPSTAILLLSLTSLLLARRIRNR